MLARSHPSQPGVARALVYPLSPRLHLNTQAEEEAASSRGGEENRTGMSWISLKAPPACFFPPRSGREGLERRRRRRRHLALFNHGSTCGAGTRNRVLVSGSGVLSRTQTGTEGGGD